MTDPFNISKDLRPLDFFTANLYSISVRRYFKYYGFDLENEIRDLQHAFGTFKSYPWTLAGHIFSPREYKATVVVVHGYLNHCAQLIHSIRHLAMQGYAVAAFDLPGHGLSTGRRAAIDDFSQYSRALADFADLVQVHFHGPCHVIGFSAGASAVMDHLFSRKNNSFDKVILAAPLVHSLAWKQVKFGLTLCNFLVDSVPRISLKESSDKSYLDFVKSDPLQVRTLPLKWVRALYAWNEKITALPICQTRVKLIQGSRDRTVDWKYNIAFVQEKFSDVDVNLIENCRHEMFNESPRIRQEVLFRITGYLEG